MESEPLTYTTHRQMEAQRFTDSFLKAITEAIETAKQLNDSELKPEHVFIHVLGKDVRSAVWFKLYRLKKRPEEIKQKLENKIERRKSPLKKEPSATKKLKKILNIARRITEKRRESNVGSLSFFKACIIEGKNVPFTVLKEVGLSSDEFASLIIKP